MREALNHLFQIHPAGSDNNESNNPTTDASIPSVILLQEMTDSDLAVIQEMPWIQQRFYVTDLTTQNWMGGYGTTTLVDKRLFVERVFRVVYSNSMMQRDALFVDVSILGPGGMYLSTLYRSLYVADSCCSLTHSLTVIKQCPRSSGLATPI